MSKNPLRNKKILITAGPTREYLDPVRFLTNGSSGEMGLVLGKVLADAGASVTIVLGPTSKSIPSGVKIIPVQSAEQMSAAVKKNLPLQDAFIATAAVGDYRFERFHQQKIKKGAASMSVRLIKNPDILQEAGEWKTKQKSNRPILIGYALETQNLRANAEKKLNEKKLDLIIGNSPASMSSAMIEGLWIEKNKVVVRFQKMNKQKLSTKITSWLKQTFNS